MHCNVSAGPAITLPFVCGRMPVMCGFLNPIWPSVPAMVALPRALSPATRSLDGRVMSEPVFNAIVFSSILLGLPVGHRPIAPFQMRRLPEFETLLLDQLFIDLDAEARQVAYRIVSTIQ